MSGKTVNDNGIWEKLKATYRISVYDIENLKELRTFNLSILAFISFALGLILMAFLIFMIIFSIKPIKHFVFGIDNVENTTAFIDLNNQVVELENALEHQTTYINGLVEMINGDQNAVLAASPEVVKIEKSEIKNQKVIESTNQAQQAEISSQELRNKLMHLVSPVRGRVSAGFNILEDHYGIDIIAPKNSPISSIADGVVINADWTIQTGNTISVQHADDLISIYKHNSALLKKVGDYVIAGEAIAIIGNTGEQTSGPHLHFELWNKGMCLDPIQFISF